MESVLSHGRGEVNSCAAAYCHMESVRTEDGFMNLGTRSVRLLDRLIP